jgi:hypothetical protein
MFGINERNAEPKQAEPGEWNRTCDLTRTGNGGRRPCTALFVRLTLRFPGVACALVYSHNCLCEHVQSNLLALVVHGALLDVEKGMLRLSRRDVSRVLASTIPFEKPSQSGRHRISRLFAKSDS